MSREKFVGKRAYHREFDQPGTILDVNFDARPQTAKFLPEEWDEDRATWVNLISLQLMPDEDQPAT